MIHKNSKHQSDPSLKTFPAGSGSLHLRAVRVPINGQTVTNVVQTKDEQNWPFEVLQFNTIPIPIQSFMLYSISDEGLIPKI